MSGRGRRWAAAGLALAGLAACLAGAAGIWLWQLAWPAGEMTLTGLGMSGRAGAPCPGGLTAAPTGPGLDANVQGVVEADLVQVLGGLTRRGWRTTTSMGTFIDLRPAQTPEVNLGLFRVRVYRGVTLAYMPERQTQVVALTTIALCGP